MDIHNTELKTVYVCDPSSLGKEAGRSGVQGHLYLCSEFETSPVNMKHCLKYLRRKVKYPTP